MHGSWMIPDLVLHRLCRCCLFKKFQSHYSSSLSCFNEYLVTSVNWKAVHYTVTLLGTWWRLRKQMPTVLVLHNGEVSDGTFSTHTFIFETWNNLLRSLVLVQKDLPMPHRVISQCWLSCKTVKGLCVHT